MDRFSGRQLPEALHYVIWFNYQSAEYEPAAVFNTKAEADFYLEELKDFGKSINQTVYGIAQTMTWSQFCAMTQNLGSKNVRDLNTRVSGSTIQVPSDWTPQQIAKFQQEFDELVWKHKFETRVEFLASRSL